MINFHYRTGAGAFHTNLATVIASGDKKSATKDVQINELIKVQLFFTSFKKIQLLYFGEILVMKKMIRFCTSLVQTDLVETFHLKTPSSLQQLQRHKVRQQH